MQYYELLEIRSKPFAYVMFCNFQFGQQLNAGKAVAKRFCKVWLSWKRATKDIKPGYFIGQLTVNN